MSSGTESAAKKTTTAEFGDPPATQDRYTLLRKRVAEWKIRQQAVCEAISEEDRELESTEFTAEEFAYNTSIRPKVRAECVPGGEKHLRPCPWAMCKYNMFDMLMSTVRVGQGPHVVRETRETADGGDGGGEEASQEYRPILSPLDIQPEISCLLDIIDRNPGGCTLDVIGDVLGLTRERIRQIHVVALRKILVRLRASPGGKELSARILVSLDLEDDPEIRRIAFDPEYKVPLPMF